MQLEAGERSILATFASSDAAAAVAAKLRQTGFETVQVDRVSQWGNPAFERQLNNPIANEAVTQSGLVLFSGVDSRSSGDVGPLLAADPAVSGMSAGDRIEGRNTLLTVVTREERVREAVRIIEEGGGQV